MRPQTALILCKEIWMDAVREGERSQQDMNKKGIAQR